jgi:hypothetical protein
MMFPREEIRALIAALKSKDYLAAIKAGWVVGKWLMDELAALGFVSASETGVLRSTEAISEASALSYLEGMAGDTQAAVDPAVLSLLLQFIVNNVLPKLLERLAK